MEAGLEQRQVEGEREGPGDGLAVEGGPGVHRVRIFVEKALRRHSSLFDRLYLNSNQLTSIPDCIGQLTNLTGYGIRFDIFNFDSQHSLIDWISAATS